MNLQLVSIHIKDSPLAMPLPVAMLKASLDSTRSERSPLQVDLLDFHLGYTAREMADRILSTSANFVGFSVYLWNFDLTLELAKILKDESTLILFAGGPEATADPIRVLEEGQFDFVVKGESEFVIQKIMSNLLLNNSVDGIESVYVKGFEAPRLAKTVMEIDDFISPFLTGSIDFSRYKGMLWELSRGCIFKCSFCFEGRGTQGVRRFSIDRLRQELELFEKENVTQVWVLDPTFNQYRDRAKELLRMISKVAPHIHFTFEVRTEFLDQEMAELFASLNCSLQIGLQSSQKDVLKNILRHFNPQRYAQRIALLNEAGAIFGLDLIYGLPGDSLIGFRKSLDYAVSLQPNNLDIFALAILPGTQLFDDAGKFELKYRPSSPYTLISSPDYSEQDMEEATKISQAFDVFYNKGSAVAWFFMILETLQLSASSFFDHLVCYFEKLKLFDSDNSMPIEKILELQLGFTNKLFIEHEKEDLFLVMSDIITYNHYMSQSLFAGSIEAPPLSKKVQISSSAFFIKLHYSIDDLMYVGEYDLEEFIDSFSMTSSNNIKDQSRLEISNNEQNTLNSYHIVYNYNGGVEVEMISDFVYQVLSLLKEPTTLEVCCQNEDVKIMEVINHALEHNIIQYVA